MFTCAQSAFTSAVFESDGAALSFRTVPTSTTPVVEDGVSSSQPTYPAAPSPTSWTSSFASLTFHSVSSTFHSVSSTFHSVSSTFHSVSSTSSSASSTSPYTSSTSSTGDSTTPSASSTSSSTTSSSGDTTVKRVPIIVGGTVAASCFIVFMIFRWQVYKLKYRGEDNPVSQQPCYPNGAPQFGKGLDKWSKVAAIVSASVGVPALIVAIIGITR